MQPSGSRRRLRNALLAVTLLLGGSAAAFATFEPGRLASSASGDTTATEAPPPRATAAEPVAAEVAPGPLTEEQKCVEATVAYGYVWADYSSAKITRYFLFGQEVSEYEHFRYRQQGNNADPSRSAATQRVEIDPQWKARLAAVPQLHPLSANGQEEHFGKLLSSSGSEATYVAQAERLCAPAAPQQAAQEQPPAVAVPPPADSPPRDDPRAVRLSADQAQVCAPLERIFDEWYHGDYDDAEARRRLGTNARALDLAITAMDEGGKQAGVVAILEMCAAF